jgi:hypothetical protein
MRLLRLDFSDSREPVNEIIGDRLHRAELLIGAARLRHRERHQNDCGRDLEQPREPVTRQSFHAKRYATIEAL